MEKTIIWWLRNRIKWSNWLNRFDRMDFDPGLERRAGKDLSGFNRLADQLKQAYADNFEYSYDFGDRLRTPWSTWNRVYSGWTLVDDCDGFAALAMAWATQYEGITCSLLTIVPAWRWWKGHTVCLCQQQVAGNPVYMYYDYDEPGRWTANLYEIRTALHEKYGCGSRCVFGEDVFKDGGWKHLNGLDLVMDP
jgi:hypothetical protein